MLRGKAPKKVDRWCKGEYGNLIIYRFFFMIALWIFYASIPHKLAPSWLLMFTFLLIVYAIVLFRWQNALMAYLIIIAAVLNTLLIPLLSAGVLTLLPIVLIYAILFWDVVSAPSVND